MQTKFSFPKLVLYAFLFMVISATFWGFFPQGDFNPDKVVIRLDPMQLAAQAMLVSLSETQKAEAVFPFDEEERKNWHFTAKTRKGLIFSKMDEKQRLLFYELLKTGLSDQGFKTAGRIMAWEDILAEMEGRPSGDDYRNPEHYYLAFFGEPGSGKPWGWRLEGHHLSLNYTSVSGQLSVTPNFMGANPATVPEGPHKGKQLLAEEEELGRRFVQSLDESQQRMAIISPTAFPEIVTGTDRIAALGKKEGIPYSALEPEQQELLDMLLKTYLDRMEPEIADKKWTAIQTEGLDNLHFAWAGGLLPGQGHYYRIHGKSFVVEYDNTQNQANHIHTVWREFSGDFGRDLLREHYGEGHRD